MANAADMEWRYGAFRVDDHVNFGYAVGIRKKKRVHLVKTSGMFLCRSSVSVGAWDSAAKSVPEAIGEAKKAMALQAVLMAADMALLESAQKRLVEVDEPNADEIRKRISAHFEKLMTPLF